MTQATVRTRVIVRYQFDKDADGNPRQENWGEYDFNVLPRQGDIIDVIHDHDYHTLEVKIVEHTGVSFPPPNTGLKTVDDVKPSQRLITDWKWSD